MSQPFRLIFARGDWHSGVVLLCFFALFLVLSVLGKVFFHLEVRSSLVFLGCVLLVFFAPGSLMLTLLSGTTANPLSRTILGLAIGVVVFPVIYRVIRHFGLDFSYVLVVVLVQSLAWLFVQFKRHPRFLPRQGILRGDFAGLMGLMFLASGLLSFTHFADVRYLDQGFQINTSYLTESVYHIGLINSLQDIYPPPALYASGTSDFSYYHLNMHLQVELIARLTGIEVLKAATYYVPFLYFCLLCALPFAFVRLLGGTAGLASFCGMLVFASDLSFIPGGLSDTLAFPWTLYFATTIWSLFTLNGYIPAVIALFTCLTLLWRFLEYRETGALAIFALCVIGGFGFKSTMGLQIAAATAATGAIWFYLDRRDQQGRWLLLTGIALSALLAVASLQVTAGSDATVIGLAPFNLLHQSMGYLGIDAPDLVWYPVVIGLLLMGGLGIRSLGLWGIRTELKQRTPRGAISLFILLFFVCGYFLSEFLFIGRPGGQNNAVWFYVQSLMACWIALILYLTRVSTGRKNSWLLFGALMILSVPSTVQFLSLRSVTDYVSIGPDEIAVIELLKSTNPSAVVLHPLNLDRPSLASNFAGRASVLNPFRSFVVEDDGLSERIADIGRFFDSESLPRERLAVLRRYRVDYVYSPVEMAHEIESTPGIRRELTTDTMRVYRFLEPRDPDQLPNQGKFPLSALP